MSNNGIKFEGLDQIVAKLDKLSDLKKAKQTMGRCCGIVEESARRKAPKDTGTLKRSITSKVEDRGHEIRGVIFTPSEYGPYIEFGTGLFAEKGGRADVPWKFRADNGDWFTTSGIKPQPFMRPAFKENRQRILKELKGGILK